MQLLTILIPVYNESDCLQILYERLQLLSEKLSCAVQILFVNDGSTDDTLLKIKEFQEKDNRITFVDLSRNYGKEIALSAGIDYTKGDALVIIDADLQDPPELIPEMLLGIEEGYDDVYAQRTNRKGETWLKRFSSKVYYKWMEKLSDIPIQKDTGDFRMFSSRAISAIKQIQEKERNMKGLFSYIGLRKKVIYYERDARIAGSTKWNYWQLFQLAIKGLTSFSIIPLRIVSLIGSIVSFSAFVYLIKVLTKALLYGDEVAGYPSLMSTLLFVSGVILLALGVMGEYIGIIYKETKNRPLYFINEIG
ncbi:MAG: glycosyltransferase family 2 protein [Bacteroidaceae bacterium]|nr:glycosyltransferase family 2 protein [Bacteroidaceae bacterium]